MKWVLGICLTVCMWTAAIADESEWRYVSNVADSAFSPLMRRLVLDANPPEDVEIICAMPKAARFAQFRYGSFDARRILIMIGQDDDGNAALFVDSNRDRLLTERERVPGSGPVWKIPLASEFVVSSLKSEAGSVPALNSKGARGEDLKKDIESVGTETEAAINTVLSEDPRFLKIRLSREVLSIGTVGWIEGEAEFAGTSLSVRRVDANANGQYADAVDLVWFDLNHDDRWDGFRERFPVRPIVRLENAIWTSAADIRGHSFRLSKVEGTGTLSLQLDELRQRGLSEISVVMAGRAGTIVQLDQSSTAIEVPVDEYRPVNVVATFERSVSPRIWRFEFVRQVAVQQTGYHAVTANEDTKLNPLDALNFSVNLNRIDAQFTAGSNIVGTPSLTTASGLRIQSVKFGEVTHLLLLEPKAELKLLDSTGSRTLVSQRSGFT